MKSLTENNRLLVAAPHAPRIVALLPFAYMFHLVEEWFGGFSAWTATVLGQEVSPERFIIINSVALSLSCIGIAAALRWPRFSWFSVSFAALIVLNGVLHGLATVALGSYSPGTLTGLLIYLPLGSFALRALAKTMQPRTFYLAVLFGFLIHGLVALAAFT
ncbi:MAG TPA: HXXEE domain-containing protein [Pyrinomonadaceae bacterium]